MPSFRSWKIELLLLKSNLFWLSLFRLGLQIQTVTIPTLFLWVSQILKFPNLTIIKGDMIIFVTQSKNSAFTIFGTLYRNMGVDCFLCGQLTFEVACPAGGAQFWWVSNTDTNSAYAYWHSGLFTFASKSLWTLLWHQWALKYTKDSEVLKLERNRNAQLQHVKVLSYLWCQKHWRIDLLQCFPQ